MFKQIYIKNILVCIILMLASNCYGMHASLHKIARKLHKNCYSYVTYRQAQHEEQVVTIPTPTHGPFSEKESDIPLEYHAIENLLEKEPVPSKNIFSRLWEFLTPKTAVIEIKSNPIPGKQIEITEYCHLKQIYVANQFSAQGGGTASCGYQSFKNALYLIKALQDSESTENLETTLNDFNLINNLFGPINKNSVGCWRTIIMQKRALAVFKNYLYHNLGLKELNAIEENTYIQFPTQECFPIKKNKIRNAYATLLNNYTQDAAKSLIEGLTTQLIIHPDLFIEYIQDHLNTSTIKNIDDFITRESSEVNNTLHDNVTCDDYDELPGLLYNYLSDIKTIEKYIDIKSITPFELSLDNTEQVFDFYNKNNSNPSQLDGDWLQEEEIYTLKKLENENNIQFIHDKRQGLLHNLDYELTIIEDVNDLTGSHGDSVNQEVFQEIILKSQKGINKAKTALADNAKEKYIHAFIIGTATRYQSTHGHWFVLALYKHDNMHEYIVMDSASNANRLYDERVKKIISLLENQDLTDKIAASPEELKNIENKIIDMLNNNDMGVLELIEHYKQCGGKKDFSEQLNTLFQN